jgi:hypothetical protein
VSASGKDGWPAALHAHSLKQGREVQAQGGQAEVRGEGEERGEQVQVHG